METKQNIVENVVNSVIAYYGNLEDRLPKIEVALRRIFPSYIVASDYQSSLWVRETGCGPALIQVRNGKDVFVTKEVWIVKAKDIYSHYIND